VNSYTENVSAKSWIGVWRNPGLRELNSDVSAVHAVLLWLTNLTIRSAVDVCMDWRSMWQGNVMARSRMVFWKD
jgi:hypothetical protein